MFLLDTMVISEQIKSRPAHAVTAWARGVPPEAQFVSVLSLGEILYGIRRLPPGARKDRLVVWHREMLAPFFASRTLSVDATVADVWAGMRAQSRRTRSPVDALIAATALAYGLALVTRNERDFAGLGVRVLNPWAS